MSDEQARARFAAAPVARLATVDGQGRPHLVPVTFAVSGGRIVTAVDHKPKRGHDLRRLRNITANPRVSVLVDHYADDWRTLWWARADGLARVVGVEAEAERAALVAPLCAKYPQYREAPPDGPAVEITVTGWTHWAAGPQAG
jgi:PPOX class probable F420-dependent enzyme